MKLSHSFYLLLFFGCLLSGCQKETFYDYGKVIDGQYIRVTINGEEKTMIATKGNIFYNSYYFDDNPDVIGGLDQLNLRRDSEDGRESIQIYALGWRLPDQSYPLVLSRENATNKSCLPVEVQLLHHDNKRTDQQTGLIDMVIEDWDDHGFMTGTFSGSTSNGTSITDGQFRIRVFQTQP